MDKSKILAQEVILEAEKSGVVEFCVCPGARNSELFHALMKATHLKKYFWFEERSGAYFALGRSRECKRPVAIVTTSGTAVGELLPATMEAYYTRTPLLLISADRPRRFRGSGAPQAAEQVGIFSHYAPFFQDVEEGEKCSLAAWNKHSPAHLNVCFEDPVSKSQVLDTRNNPQCLSLEHFLEKTRFPFVVVGALHPSRRQRVANFLLSLKAPAFLEGVSGLREDARLQNLRITRTDKLWPHASQSGHHIDGVLRLGGVPTFRLWRDLEDRMGQVAVCCLSDIPFSGLSWGKVESDLSHRYLDDGRAINSQILPTAEAWVKSDRTYSQRLHQLFEEEPTAEASLIHQLSRRIPRRSHIYLGNSLPIREWDQAACLEDREFRVTASRGVNGIDGQISTFLGLSSSDRDNWAILGDLTALYDMAGPWILQQMPEYRINIVVVNNSGGQIFARLFSHKEFLHSHNLNFKPLADMWGLHYERWTRVPEAIAEHNARLIEIVPDEAATRRFWQKIDAI